METKVCRECGSAFYAKGLCRKHYGIERYYAMKGSPRARPERHSVQRWVSSHARHSGDECLIWPFFRDPRSGYARMSYRGKNRAAHHVMCRAAYGEPPSDRPFALHTCGKGQEGCVNPRHLRWGTTYENAMDRAIHGTETCGSAVWSARLTAEDVRSIRRQVDAGEKQASVARLFGVHPSHISKIMSGHKWALALGNK